MPLGGRLTDEEIATFKNWIEAARNGTPAVDLNGALSRRRNLPTGSGKYWAFQKVVKPAVPAAKQQWVRNPIDAFVLAAKLEAKKIKPNPARR